MQPSTSSTTLERSNSQTNRYWLATSLRKWWLSCRWHPQGTGSGRQVPRFLLVEKSSYYIDSICQWLLRWINNIVIYHIPSSCKSFASHFLPKWGFRQWQVISWNLVHPPLMKCTSQQSTVNLLIPTLHSKPTFGDSKSKRLLPSTPKGPLFVFRANIHEVRDIPMEYHHFFLSCRESNFLMVSDG